MRNLHIFFSLFCILITNPVNTYAEEKYPEPPIRSLINWLDHWYRKDFSLERHVKYTCEQYEASKIGGAFWIRNFHIHETQKIGEVYFIHATYSGKGKTRYVKAQIKKQGDLWVNEEFIISFSKNN